MEVRDAWYAALEATHGAPFTTNHWTEYNENLAKLIEVAIESRRLDPTRALIVHDETGTLNVSVMHHDFAWDRSDFQRLYPARKRCRSPLERHYACRGVGVPLVAVRCRQQQCPLEGRFYPEQSAFAVTAVLRFDEAGEAVFEFYNPLARPSLQCEQLRLPIARDTSASLAWALREAPRTYLTGFVHPGDPATASRLTFLEPYQPGKIPVVFTHGLLSDPDSMADLVNDLRAVPGFFDSFQVWYYRYPTGQGILQSAAVLREELEAAVTGLDPTCADPALRHIVLVGHSMGGLISKLQVTYSEDRIWRRIAKQPLENIWTSERTRGELARLTYFDPSPHVGRVVFIATPHSGGLPYSDLLGRGASHLVNTPSAQEAMHQQLLKDNPGIVEPWVERGFPTSIDMLAADSPLLSVMKNMRISERVALHNIIGISHCLSLDGPSDSVVSANSAEHHHCQSVLVLRKSHMQIHRSKEAAEEIWRILTLHRAVPPVSITSRE